MSVIIIRESESPTNVGDAQKADFAKSWVQIVIEVYFLRTLGLSIDGWGLEARTRDSVSRFKSISADRPETVDLPRVQSGVNR